MKTKIPHLIWLALALAILPIISLAGVEVNIPGANLRAKLEEALGKKAGDPITDLELAGLSRVQDTVSKGIPEELQITDLTGLEHCTSLTLLHLNNNQISDISPLSNLTNRTQLHLYINQIMRCLLTL